MNEKDPKRAEQPEIVVNQYGQTKDPAVVVDDAARTILVTPDETLVLEKEPAIDIVPRNRPRNIYAGVWGRNEIVTVALGVFAVLVVVLIYVFLVIPSNREVAKHETDYERLKADLTSARDNYGDATSTETKVARVLKSEEDFEAKYLPPVATGRNALYQRLNGLIDAFGLVNTAGPDYAPLATLDQGDRAQSEEERGREKYRSLFPGLYVSMTVEGSYQNIRRFIRELESGQEFIVISAVQIEPSEGERQANQQEQQPTAAQSGGFPTANPNAGPVYVPPKGKTHGEVVSLHLEMAAYFRRPNFAASESERATSENINY
jgi:Tfp pilus assembly protein PilO